MHHDGATYWCDGYLPDFGGPRGAIIASREAHNDIFDVAEALGWHIYVEVSTRGGWHVYVFTDEPLPFVVMRRSLKAWAQEAGLEAGAEEEPGIKGGSR
jgi:hypothetical protein